MGNSLCVPPLGYNDAMINPSERTAWRVCSFESRRADEMRNLIARHGGTPTIAPSMREVPLEEHSAASVFVDALKAGEIDAVVFLTGVGARALMDVAQTQMPAEEFCRLLNGCRVFVRGPKPQAVLREWGVPIDGRAKEPNTWRELLEAIQAAGPLAGQRIAVQEYGERNDEFYAALRELGAEVMPVAIYRWALPEDTQPLREAISATIDGGFDLLLFTSAQQLNHVVQVAEQMGQREAWLEAARQCAVASIGPTCSERLREFGLPVDLEPSHPKMGPLVKEALAALPGLIAGKRRE